MITNSMLHLSDGIFPYKGPLWILTGEWVGGLFAIHVSIEWSQHMWKVILAKQLIKLLIGKLHAKTKAFNPPYLALTSLQDLRGSFTVCYISTWYTWLVVAHAVGYSDANYDSYSSYDLVVNSVGGLAACNLVWRSFRRCSSLCSSCLVPTTDCWCRSYHTCQHVKGCKDV